ncbi:hypothetical protein PHYBOEH_003763 [Phytophthora boehmeriae]|uniref:RRM domain-containing protein n=1 Tax=Phytophthora boehmeriae TaxID=109152 RepID=A0A8T1WNE9_9STRA|nr:hypothetical protein PHYBOEH_003763 [Phytophthora boehmeriae]
MEPLEPEASTKLYIGNLFYELTQRDVEEEFSKFGPIEQCSVKKGYAFVHYEQLQDAETAVQEMNDKELGGRRLRVAFAVSSGFPPRRFDGPPPPQSQAQAPPPMKHRSPRFGGNVSANLFVANIPSHIKMSQLDQAFAQFGEVKNVKILPQARADAPMSAFVDYADVEAAQKAHSATIMVAGQHLRTDYNFRKSKNGEGPRRMSRGSFDGPGGYDNEREGGRPRYDSFDSQSGRKSYAPRHATVVTPRREAKSPRACVNAPVTMVMIERTYDVPMPNDHRNSRSLGAMRTGSIVREAMSEFPVNMEGGTSLRRISVATVDPR